MSQPGSRQVHTSIWPSVAMRSQGLPHALQVWVRSAIHSPRRNPCPPPFLPLRLSLAVSVGTGAAFAGGALRGARFAASLASSLGDPAVHPVPGGGVGAREASGAAGAAGSESLPASTAALGLVAGEAGVGELETDLGAASARKPAWTGRLPAGAQPVSAAARDLDLDALSR